MIEVLNVLLDILGIIAIICLGAFVVVLIGDLILSTFDGHEGVFFHKNKKANSTNNDPTPVTNVNNTKTQEVSVVPYYQTVEATEVEEEPVVVDEPVTAVDFNKAAEEQKLLQKRGIIKEPVKQEVEEPMFSDIEEDNDNELAEAIKETTKEALDAIANEEHERKIAEETRIAEEARMKAEEEARLAEEARIKAEEKLRQAEEEARIKAEEEARRAEEKAKEVYVESMQEDDSINELRKLREDIFTLRRNTLQDVQELKESSDQNEIIQAKREYNRQMKEKLKELDELKLNNDKLNAEREELLKYKEIALARENEIDNLLKDKQELENQVVELNSKEDVNQKPYYSKEYYEKKLADLQKELSEIEKELRANKREFIPLQRIKKSYERDQAKLRRKEAIVAKQKVALYGGTRSTANIDPERQAKLDENVKILNELKESVFHCDQVLKQNKDRYPVLEKENKLLVKTYNRLMSDIENVKAAIAWYDENEDGSQE